MCLIIAGNGNKVRNALLQTPGLLADIVDGNKDGIGSMFTTDDGVLVVAKTLPKDILEARAFIAQLPETDRDLALHFRMRTHGDIDLTNCHPYPVLDGQLHMMHNGVIRNIDDSSDKTKSDTWHYIEKVLKPQLEVAPNLITIPGWQRLVREDIGSNNKFVLLNKDGELVILNRSTGIEHDGLWFSNTYAWSPEILIPDYRGWGRYGSYGNVWGVDDEVGYGAWQSRTYGSAGGTQHTPTKITPAIKPDDVWAAVNDGDADTVYKFLDSYPVSTMMILFEKDKFVCSVELDQLSQQDAKIVQMVQNGEQQRLVQYCNKSAGRCRKVAEVIAWYGYWEGKEQPAEKTGGVQQSFVDEDGELTELQVVDGQVVKVQNSADEENPDDADLETWRADFQKWLDRQQAGLTNAPRHQPAKWTAQTPALLTSPEPAQVAPIKSRSIHYRGYRIEVPMQLFEQGQWGALREHLDKEAVRMHDEELAKRAQTPLVEEVSTDTAKDAAHNEAYAG